jgi:large subunit ribosomal protein L15
MKLHDLRPAKGSNTARTRVGRGIAAGKGKTAGRGTKGQKARAGGSIPPWFEGGQTPLHMRIPKLRGFKNRAKIEYEVVNVGAIAQRVEAGAFAQVGGGAKAGTAPRKGEQLTINADTLRAVGLVRDVKKPLKVLGGGELSAALFVVADAFTKSATQKIEAAGGAVSVLEVPTETRSALGREQGTARPPRAARTAEGRAVAERKADARTARAADAKRAADEAAAASTAKTARAPKAADEAAEANPAKAAKPAKAPRAEKDSKTGDRDASADAVDSPDGAAVASAGADTDVDGGSADRPAVNDEPSSETDANSADDAGDESA